MNRSSLIIVSDLEGENPQAMTFEEVAGLLGIKPNSLYEWFVLHPEGGGKKTYLLSRQFYKDEDIEKFKSIAFSPWGREFCKEWTAVVTPFRRLVIRRERRKCKTVKVEDKSTIWAS